MKRAVLVLRRWLVRQKVHFQRGYGYFGYLGIGYLVANTFSEQMQNMGINLPLWLVAPVALGLVWLMGYIEIRFSLFADELDYYAENNPSYQILKKGIYRNDDTGTCD